MARDEAAVDWPAMATFCCLKERPRALVQHDSWAETQKSGNAAAVVCEATKSRSVGAAAHPADAISDTRGDADPGLRSACCDS